MDARFDGAIDGAATRSFRGSVERAGPDPYLLLGVEVEGGRWILDVSGLPPGEAVEAVLRLTLENPDRRRSSGAARARVRRLGSGELAARVEAELAGEAGTHALAGEVRWVAPAVRTVRGRLRLRLGDADHGVEGSAEAELAPFDDGWRLGATVSLLPGESAHVQLDLPRIATTDLAGEAAARLIHTRQRGEDIEVRPLPVEGIRGRAALDGPAFALRLEGRAGGEPVRLRFEGRRD